MVRTKITKWTHNTLTLKLIKKEQHLRNLCKIQFCITSAVFFNKRADKSSQCKDDFFYIVKGEVYEKYA